MHRISSFKKRRTEADKARIQSMYCLLDERESSNERLLLIQCLPFFINLIESEKRYKPKVKSVRASNSADLRYLMLLTSNNCVPPNLRQNPSKLQDSEGFSSGFNYNFSLELLQGLFYIFQIFNKIFICFSTLTHARKRGQACPKPCTLKQLTESLQQLLGESSLPFICMVQLLMAG